MHQEIEFIRSERPSTEVLLINPEMHRRWIEMEEAQLAFWHAYFAFLCAAADHNGKLVAGWNERVQEVYGRMQSLQTPFDHDYGEIGQASVNLSRSDLSRVLESDPSKSSRLDQLIESRENFLAALIIARASGPDVITHDEAARDSVELQAETYENVLRQYHRDFLAAN